MPVGWAGNLVGSLSGRTEQFRRFPREERGLAVASDRAMDRGVLLTWIVAHPAQYSQRRKGPLMRTLQPLSVALLALGACVSAPMPTDPNADPTTTGAGGSGATSGTEGTGGVNTPVTTSPNVGSGGAVPTLATGGAPGTESGPPAKLVTLASGQASPYVIAVDAQNVYWANWGSFNDLDGSVTRIPLGGGTPTVLVPKLRAPGGIAVDATSVYFTGGQALAAGGPGLFKVPLAGGVPVALATGFINDPIALGAGAVYGSGTQDSAGTTIISTPLDGGTVRSVVPASALQQSFATYGITTDATSVYWTTFSAPCAVMKAPLGGGAPVALATVSSGAGSGIAVDASHVYAGAGQTVVKIPLAGGAPVTLATSGGQGIAIDESYVYFTNFSSSGKVQKVAKSGGPAIVLATDQSMPWGIAVDATSVYWVNAGNESGQAPWTGSVMKLTPK
jgi:hypothetical protein